MYLLLFETFLDKYETNVFAIDKISFKKYDSE